MQFVDRRQNQTSRAIGLGALDSAAPTNSILQEKGIDLARPPNDIWHAPDDRPEVIALLANLKRSLPELQKLLDACNDHWGGEDAVYRFYHHSFKVYGLQSLTERIVAALRELAPDRPLHEWFMQIVNEGIGKQFEPDHNARWLQVTRPIIEAFFHARYFLEMACRYGRELEAPPRLLPSGWASILYLYGFR